MSDTATTADPPSDDEDVRFHSTDDEVEPAAPSPEAAMDTRFVYAIGQLDFRFPTLALEKEVAQVIGPRRELTDEARQAERVNGGIGQREAVLDAISRKENRYLARGMCWVFSVEGLETYLLLPRDPADVEVLIDAVRPYPSRDDIDVVVGVRGPVAPPEMCNGLSIPMVMFDQLYSFDRASFVAAIPPPGTSETDEQQLRFRQTAGDLFDYVMQMSDNAGATDEHRALNYLAMRNPAIYALVADQQAEGAALSGIDVRPSPLSGTRKVVDVVFAFTRRDTGVSTKYSARVDVSEQWPFLMTQLSPYYEVN